MRYLWLLSLGLLSCRATVPASPRNPDLEQFDALMSGVFDLRPIEALLSESTRPELLRVVVHPTWGRTRCLTFRWGGSLPPHMAIRETYGDLWYDRGLKASDVRVHSLDLHLFDAEAVKTLRLLCDRVSGFSEPETFDIRDGTSYRAEYVSTYGRRGLADFENGPPGSPRGDMAACLDLLYAYAKLIWEDGAGMSLGGYSPPEVDRHFERVMQEMKRLTDK